MSFAAAFAPAPATRGRQAKLCLAVSALMALAVPAAADYANLECSEVIMPLPRATAITTSVDGVAQYAGYIAGVGNYYWLMLGVQGCGGQYFQLDDANPTSTQPTGIAVDDSGLIYISNANTNTVTIASDPLVVWGGTGAAAGQFDQLSGIAIDGPFLYAADRGNHRLQKLLLDGTPVASFGVYGNDPGELAQPTAVAVDRAGYLYVTDYENHKVQKYTTEGTFVTEWAVHRSWFGEFWPHAITADGDGRVFVADSMEVQRFTDSGTLSYSWGVWGVMDIATDGQGGIHVLSDLGNLISKYQETEGTDVGRPPSLPELTIENLGPNPFRDRIQLSWTQPTAGPTEISLVDVSGRRLATLASGIWPAGRHETSWSATEGASRLPAGIYWIRVRSQGREISRALARLR